MRTTLAILFIAIGVSGQAVTITSGKATATGGCSVAHSGNHDTIVIKNCGIGIDQGNKIIELLNKVLVGQDLSTINAKLDQLIKVASVPTIIQQISTGPNSPNIAGSGNQVSYTDTSELPILGQAQIKGITDQLSMMKYKVIIKFNMDDKDANLFASDLVTALKDAGWDADWQAGMGGPGIQNPVPIVMGVKNQGTPEAGMLQHVLSTTLGFQVPGIVVQTIPDGEIWIVLISHPVRRPQ